jgi:hypothetical protein
MSVLSRSSPSWVARFRRRRGSRVGRGGRVEVDAEQGVVVGQGADRDRVAVTVLPGPDLLGSLLGAALLGQRKPHLVSSRDVDRVGDDAVAGPAALVAGDQLVVAERFDPGW